MKYTTDDFYGFALTGNRFMQNSAEDKRKAYSDIVALAEKNGGIIERPYLCVLYIAKKSEIVHINQEKRLIYCYHISRVLYERYGYKLSNNIAPTFNFGAQTDIGARIAVPVI